MLQFYNTLTRTKQDFVPQKTSSVSLYTCGPTVYHFAHIGNLRTYIFGDILKRTLLHAGYSVTHIMNITDVGHLVSDADEGEDKMEKGAKREGKTAWEVAEYYTRAFLEDYKTLNLVPPTKFTKATDHIKEQIAWIKKLEKLGYTYQTSDGMYFDTSKFKDYGKLTRQNLAELKEGARVEKNSEKKHATDFALWKFSPKGKKRDMEWESPWGTGFPGWHLECSVMAQKYLGDTLDIHCGAIDLIPTHHTNEIAQAEAVTGKPFSRFWMHAEFIVLKGDAKMSKSDGNFLTLSELKQKGFLPLAYRFFTFTAHYRQKLTFSFEALDAAQKALKNLYAHVRMWDDPKGSCKDAERSFFSAIEDDLNMPRAIAALWQMVKSDAPSSAKHASLIRMDAILGLGISDVQPLAIPEEVKKLLASREQARKEKRYDLSDAIRKEIEKKGFRIDDTPEGPVLNEAV